MESRRAVALRSVLALLALGLLALGTWRMFDRHVLEAGLRARALALAASEVALLERVSRLTERSYIRPKPAQAPVGQELADLGGRLESTSKELAEVARAAAPNAGEPWAIVLSGPGGLAVGCAGLAKRLRSLPKGFSDGRAAEQILASSEGLRQATDSLRDDLERENEDAVRRLRENALLLLGLALAGLGGLGTLILRPVWRSLRREMSRLGILFEATLNSLADGVVVVDRQGRVLEMNPAARKILGEPVDGGDAAQWAERFHLRRPDGKPLAPRDVPILRAMEGEVVETEIYMQPPSRPSGVWISTKASPLRDPRGVVEGGVSIFRDITGRKHMEEELRLKTEELARSNAELETFASIASHELQEPMRKIVAFGERLRMRSGGTLAPESREDLERIEKAAQRMIHLMDSLLRYAKVNLRADGLERVPLEEVLEDALLDLEARVQSSGGSIEHDRLPAVLGDRSQLEQVFRNLVSNALKFRKPEEPPRVRITVREKADAWEIAFADRGIGFDPAYAAQLFQPFSRLHPRDRFEGSGMGLAISRRIALRHGGDLRAEGKLGEGATFILRLPKLSKPEEAR